MTKVTLAGKLNDVQGAFGSAVLHLLWGNSGQTLEQTELRQLVGHRVVMTIEISDCNQPVTPS